MCSVVYSNSTSPVTLNLNLLLGFFSIQQYGQFVDCILTGSQLKLPFQWVKRPCFTKAVKYKLHLKGWELQPRLLFIQPGNQGTVLFSSADAHTCQLLFPLQPDWLPSDSLQSWQCWDFLTVAVLHCLEVSHASCSISWKAAEESICCLAHQQQTLEASGIAILRALFG